MITRGLREIQSLSKFSWQLDTKCSIPKTDIKTFLFEPINERRVFEIILSSGRVGGGGARNMKSMWPSLAAIFFMTYLYRAGGGGHGPLGTPWIHYCKIPQVPFAFEI